MDQYLDHPDQKALIRENSHHFNNAVEVVAATQTLIPNKGEEGHDDSGAANDEHLDIKPVHITSNIWPAKRAGKEMKKRVSRSFMHGVEMRTLLPPHILSGQTGLFAVNPFEQFDIIGEYCGEVHSGEIYTPPKGGGEYCAHLEDYRHTVFPIGLDAQSFGNECRAINHFNNIAEKPNVIMKRCYVDELPRIMIICKRDVAVGEEFLLDYGKEYVDSHLS